MSNTAASVEMVGGNDKGTAKKERDTTLMNDYKRDRYRERERGYYRREGSSQ